MDVCIELVLSVAPKIQSAVEGLSVKVLARGAVK